MKHSCDAVVIGGGIIGMSIARDLAKRGRSVAIYDKGALGEEASKAAAGVLMPLLRNLDTDESASAGNIQRNIIDKEFFSLCVDSLNRYRKFIEEIQEENDSRIFFGAQGVLHLAFTKEEAAALKAMQASFPVESKWKSREELRRNEPALSPEIEAGVCFSSYRHVHNQDLCALLAMDLEMQQPPVDVHEYAQVRKIERTSSGVTISTDEGTCSARDAVLAAGSWSSLIECSALPIPPIKPVRGQILKVLAPSRTFLRHPVYWKDCYVVPRGRELIVGSTLEDAGYEKRVTVGASADILRKAIHVIPSIAECSILDSWSGLRPMTADGYPIIGKIDEHLFVATGHYRDGILLAPATAAYMAELICDGKTNLMIKSFGVERFRQQNTNHRNDKKPMVKV